MKEMTPEKHRQYHEAFAEAFKMAEQEYLERKRKQALENKQEKLSKNTLKTEQSASKSAQVH